MAQENSDAIKELRREIDVLRRDRDLFESDMTPIPGMGSQRFRAENLRRMDVIDGLIEAKTAELAKLETP